MDALATLDYAEILWSFFGPDMFANLQPCVQHAITGGDKLLENNR